jgi:hypothetical protein
VRPGIGHGFIKPFEFLIAQHVKLLQRVHKKYRSLSGATFTNSFYVEMQQ